MEQRAWKVGDKARVRVGRTTREGEIIAIDDSTATVWVQGEDGAEGSSYRRRLTLLERP